MRCIAVIDIQKEAFDTVIIWADHIGDQLVAIAYKDGRTHMVRPLDARTFEDGMTETRNAYGLDHGYLTRVQNWSPRLEAPFPPFPDRWVLS